LPPLVVEDGGVEGDAGGGEEAVHGVGLEDVGGGALDDLAVAGDEPQVVGQQQRLRHVVAGQEHGLAAVVGQRVEQLHGLDAAGHVEEGGGLVEDDDGCLLRQGAGYHGLLALTVAQVGDIAADLVTDAHVGDGLVDNLMVLGAEATQEARVGLAAQGDEFADGESAHGDAVGGDEADEARTLALRDVIDILALDFDGSRQGACGAGECTQQGGLAGAVLAQQSDESALMHGEVEVAEQRSDTLALRIADGEVMGSENHT